ncbi:Uncharacterized conserved protein YkwD, contains CAP (CSP/antigen 5/PR1) domain [Flavobacterium frigoris]|uniref:Uncharacterized conserved protein YkwD, contains CAP (CSP/antigen 5/PR1) domain n=1 Tax=Flavobacterium frigoris TaxID=229204 RepID=A0A1H9MBF7_FLAFI|nr:Uncharacterized conserved protein YkwD, contains CAP (CSP/antigen 5/PR1) domain [Flavobacterium frigoris]
MKTKSFFALLLTTVICTLNSCSTDSYETPGTSAESLALEKRIRTKTPVPTPTTDLHNYSYSSVEIQLMDLINAYRVSKGLNSLVKTNYISIKAEEHNNYMLSTNILSHDNFAVRSQDIMKTLGARSVGENVAYNSSTAQAAFDAWMASPGHKTNIEGAFTNFGMSIRVNSSTGRKYYTNIFAKI